MQPHAQHVMQVTATCVTALEYATRRHLIPSSANAESSHRHPCGYRHSAKLDMLGVADPHVLCGAPTDKTANEHATTTIIRTMGVLLFTGETSGRNQRIASVQTQQPKTSLNGAFKILGRCETLRESQTHRRSPQRYSDYGTCMHRRKR